MNDQILDLINDYLKDVSSFMRALKNKIGDANPLSSARNGRITKSGQLQDGDKIFKYSFHGRGCEVIINDRIVDFDFGNHFRYWPHQLASKRLSLSRIFSGSSIPAPMLGAHNVRNQWRGVV